MAGNVTMVKIGSYRLRYKDYTRNVTAKSDRAAAQLLAKFIVEIDEGDYTKSAKFTFGNFIAQKWIPMYVERDLAPKTQYRYKQILETRILPVFGQKPLEKIKRVEIVEFLDSLRQKHKYMSLKKDGTRKQEDCDQLSELTVNYHQRVISSVFSWAFENGYFKGDNPACRIKKHRIEQKEARFYNMEQVEAMLKVLSDEPMGFQVAIALALNAGLRMGELGGLEWQDVNFINKSLKIERTSQYLPHQGLITKAPKSKTSRREIALDNGLLALLTVYRDDQRSKGFLCAKGNRLLVRWNGEPIDPTILGKWFPDFLSRHGLPMLNLHGLRHTHATILISSGTDIQTVSGRLGHASSVVTLSIYSHCLKTKDRAAADTVEGLFKQIREVK